MSSTEGRNHQFSVIARPQSGRGNPFLHPPVKRRQQRDGGTDRHVGLRPPRDDGGRRPASKVDDIASEREAFCLLPHPPLPKRGPAPRFGEEEPGESFGYSRPRGYPTFTRAFVPPSCQNAAPRRVLERRSNGAIRSFRGSFGNRGSGASEVYSDDVTAIHCSVVNFRSTQSPLKRPTPLCFSPPNMTWASSPMDWSFTCTMPLWSLRAT